MKGLCALILFVAAWAVPPQVASARSLAGDMSGWTVTKAEFEAGITQITAQPHADNDTSYYVAPAALLGDWSRGGNILFDKKSSGGSYFSGSDGDVGDIVLTGPSGTATYRLPEDHSGEWRRFSVALDGTGWQLSGGATTLQDVLEKVTGFRIRAEYGVGSDESALRGVLVVFKDLIPEGGDETGAEWKPVGDPITGGLTSILAVQNGPSRPTRFKLTVPMRLDRITTYHWNHGKGATPGTIALKADDGTIFGPWPTTGSDGMGGVTNANWHAKPGVVLDPGSYQIIDSQPETWATNDELEGRGYFKVVLQPVERVASPMPPKEPTDIEPSGGVLDETYGPPDDKEGSREGKADDSDATRPSIREDLDVSDLVQRLREIIGTDGR